MDAVIVHLMAVLLHQVPVPFLLMVFLLPDWVMLSVAVVSLLRVQVMSSLVMVEVLVLQAVQVFLIPQLR